MKTGFYLLILEAVLASSVAFAHTDYDPNNPPTSEIICRDTFRPLVLLGVPVSAQDHLDCITTIKGHAKQIASIWVCQDLVRLYGFGRLVTVDDMMDCFRIIIDRLYTPEQIDLCNSIPSLDYASGRISSAAEIIDCMSK